MYQLVIEVDGCKDLEDVKKFMNLNGIRIIFFAETHGIIKEELSIQDKIINTFKPSCYLYELLEEEKIVSGNDFKKFLKTDDSKDFSIISTFAELKPVVRLTQKYNLPIIGCDITNMCRDNKNFLNKKELTKEERLNEEIIMKKREERQKKVIEKSLTKYKGIIFISLGAFHLRDNSLILQRIKQDSIIIYPLVNGNTLNELEEDFNLNDIKEVIYVVKNNKSNN